MASLYLHIPYCLRKCPYCSFPSVADDATSHSSYCASLVREISTLKEHSPQQRLSTIFIGGGTPTVLQCGELEAIFHGVRESFHIHGQSEISIEVNPGAVSKEQITTLLKNGVNRVSIGVQSLVESELTTLGRIHSVEEALRCIGMVQEAGCANISVDLMYGLPGQTPEQWRRSLNMAIGAGIQHMSLYQLTIENDTNTPFVVQKRRGELILPTEEQVLAMDEATAELCSRSGHQRYEISNYARAGYECRHNINYWHNNDYFAAGAGAVSKVAGVRAARETDPRRYCRLIESGRSAIATEERLTLEESFRETVIMGLRMVRGISCRELEHRFALSVEGYYRPKLQRLMEYGLVEISSGFLRLTEKGLPLANSVMAELV